MVVSFHEIRHLLCDLIQFRYLICVCHLLRSQFGAQCLYNYKPFDTQSELPKVSKPTFKFGSTHNVF